MTRIALRGHKGTRHVLREALGFNVRRLRRLRGWSQETLSERAGFCRSYLAGVECGRRNPGLDTLGRIAAALDVAVTELLVVPQEHFAQQQVLVDAERGGALHS